MILENKKFNNKNFFFFEQKILWFFKVIFKVLIIPYLNQEKTWTKILT